MDSDELFVWNFFACFSDVIFRETSSLQAEGK